jgi:WD40 repeat protein
VGNASPASCLSNPTTISARAFSPDGTRLACGSLGGKGPHNLSLIDLAAEKTLVTVRANTRGVEAVAYSADGSRIATFGGDGLIQIWDVQKLLRAKP